MAEEPKIEEVIDETKTNDESGEIKKEENKGEKEEVAVDEGFDESKIDDEVKNYKPEVKKEEVDEGEDPEDKARIEKIMEKKFGGPLKDIEKKIEMDTFFNSNPELAKYRHAVELYKAHPTYAGVPIHNLTAMLSAKDMIKVGAAKEREAQRKVAETKTPGSSVRQTTTGGTNWSSVSKSEFEAKKAEILGRPGV